MADTYPNEAAVLTAVGRDPNEGWQVVGRSMEVKTQTVQDPRTTDSSTEQVPTGNYKWVIAGPNGQTDYIVVHPDTDPTSPNKGGVGYTITAPPTRQLGTAAPPPKEGDTRDNVDGGYQIQEVYKGGSWTKNPTVKPVPFTPETQARPAEGATRKTVDQGYLIQQIYQNGTWLTDPSVDPVAWSPSAKAQPEKGDTRTNVNQGYAVTEVYNGAQWVVDTSKPPVAYTPEAVVSSKKAAAAPNKGDKRLTIDGGYQVGEVYDGTAWVKDPSVTPVPVTGAAKTSEAQAANLPKEGDKRTTVDGGYVVPQIYSKGTWITDTSPDAPAPRKYVPGTPTTVSTSADQPMIASRDDQGNVTWIPNQNYTPTDPALRAVQLQQQVQAKRSDLEQQVRDNKISAPQATDQFNQWYGATIQPQAQAIQAAQAQQTFKSQIEAAQSANQTWQAATQAQQAATQYGTNAADVALKAMPFRVGPGFEQAANQLSANFANAAKGQAPQPIDVGSAATFTAPDPNELYRQGTAQALAHLSPTAAGIAGMPFPTVPTQPDYLAAFNAAAYTPGTGGATPGSTATIAGGNYNPQAAPMPTVPGPGGATGPIINGKQVVTSPAAGGAQSGAPPQPVAAGVSYSGMPSGGPPAGWQSYAPPPPAAAPPPPSAAAPPPPAIAPPPPAAAPPPPVAAAPPPPPPPPPPPAPVTQGSQPPVNTWPGSTGTGSQPPVNTWPGSTGTGSQPPVNTWAGAATPGPPGQPPNAWQLLPQQAAGWLSQPPVEVPGMGSQRTTPVGAPPVGTTDQDINNWLNQYWPGFLPRYTPYGPNPYT
jgi:hypothetical protein